MFQGTICLVSFDLLVEGFDSFDEPSLLFPSDTLKNLLENPAYPSHKVRHTTCAIASSENKTRKGGN
jgi:hypothetical protein